MTLCRTCAHEPPVGAKRCPEEDRALSPGFWPVGGVVATAYGSKRAKCPRYILRGDPDD